MNLATQTEVAEDTAAPGAKPATPPPSVAAPEEIAKFFPQLEILECLGRGGMGVVYKARQPRLNRLVALKILAPEREKDPAFAGRFEQEAQALARLSHPGIVTLYEFGQVRGDSGAAVPATVPAAGDPAAESSPATGTVAGTLAGATPAPLPPPALYYFLMEYVDGVTLRQLLGTGRISAREALAIVPQICDALQFAHDQGIVHRDIKPENILLDRRGRVKVADFGLAKLVGGNEPLTPALSPSDGERVAEPGEGQVSTAEQILGTPNYMSPEQIAAPGEVDHRADIYALGVVFYQMLTGELPGQRLEPPSRKVHIDVRLDAVVLRALEKKPELRYQQVSDVKTAVETIATETGGMGRLPTEPSPASGLFKPEAEQLGRDLAALTQRGFVSFAKTCLLGLADQALLLFDFTATVTPFTERGGRRRFNFWPSLLLFSSSIGFLVNIGILAISLVQRCWHGQSLSLMAHEQQMLIWAVIAGVGRLAALNLGAGETPDGERTPVPRGITARRLGIVFRRLLLLVALSTGAWFITWWLIGLSEPAQAQAAVVARWTGFLILGGFVAMAAWWYVRLLLRVQAEVKRRKLGRPEPEFAPVTPATTTESQRRPASTASDPAPRFSRKTKWLRISVVGAVVLLCSPFVALLLGRLFPGWVETRFPAAESKTQQRDVPLEVPTAQSEMDFSPAFNPALKPLPFEALERWTTTQAWFREAEKQLKPNDPVAYAALDREFNARNLAIKEMIRGTAVESLSQRQEAAAERFRAATAAHDAAAASAAAAEVNRLHIQIEELFRLATRSLNQVTNAAFAFRWVAAEGDTNSPADVLPDASNPAGARTLRVLRPVVLSERDVDSAGFSQYQADQKEIAVFLNPRGGEKFAEATGKNIGRQLAIVWQGRVLSAPVVRAAITGRRVSINGRFSDAEAQQLLDVLNHRTPAPTQAP